MRAGALLFVACAQGAWDDWQTTRHAAGWKDRWKRDVMRDAVGNVGVHLIVKKTSEWCGSISMFGTAHCLLLVELEHDELGDDDEGKYKLLMLEQLMEKYKQSLPMI